MILLLMLSLYTTLRLVLYQSHPDVTNLALISEHAGGLAVYRHKQWHSSVSQYLTGPFKEELFQVGSFLKVNF